MSPRPSGFTVVRDADPVPDALRGAVIAIGNFDGVHRGHRAVIDAAKARAEAIGAPALAFTFEPHPRAVFSPGTPLFRLTPEPVKLSLLAACGLDGAVIATFDRALASVEAETFVSEVLVGRLGIRGVAIGFDFHFGHGRRGSPAFLAKEGRSLGFTVDVVPALLDGTGPVSSSAIRADLAHGRVASAAANLGYPWFVVGPVVHGDARGRTLGYPTANLVLDPAIMLAHGIYAVRCDVEGAVFDGVASYGRRPTFGDGAPLLEVFLFDFSGDLYGRTLAVSLLAWQRPELKFDSAAALVDQMDADAAQARAFLAGDPRHPPVFGLSPAVRGW